MAFGTIVNTPATDSAGASATTVTVTLASTATSGNLIVACHVCGASNSTIDSTGFVEATSCTDTSDTDQGAIYYKVSDGTETTVVCRGNGSTSHGLTVIEVEGAINATPVDVTGNDDTYQVDASGECGTPSVSTIDGGFAVAMSFCNANGGRSVSSWSDSFTAAAAQKGNGYKWVATATRLLSGTASITPVATYSSTPTYGHMGCCVVFSPVVAGGGLSIPVAMHHYARMRNN